MSCFVRTENGGMVNVELARYLGTEWRGQECWVCAWFGDEDDSYILKRCASEAEAQKWLDAVVVWTNGPA